MLHTSGDPERVSSQTLPGSNIASVFDTFRSWLLKKLLRLWKWEWTFICFLQLKEILPVFAGLSLAVQRFSQSLQEFQFECTGDAETDDEINIGETRQQDNVLDFQVKHKLKYQSDCVISLQLSPWRSSRSS